MQPFDHVVYTDKQGRGFMEYYTYCVYLTDYTRDISLIYYFGTEEKLATEFLRSMPGNSRWFSNAKISQCINKLGYNPSGLNITDMIIVSPCQCKLCKQMRIYDTSPHLGVPYMAISETEQNAKRIDSQFKKLILARQEMNKLLPR